MSFSDLLTLRQYIALDNSQAAQHIAGKILDSAGFLKEYPILGKAGRYLIPHGNLS